MKNLRFVVLLCCALIAVGSAGYAAEKEPLTVYFLDVGQGDATVITTPAGKTVLIDGGMGGSGYKKKDKGKTVIIPFLKQKGIKKIDTIVMTHPDQDHIGGLVYILENTRPGSEYPLEIKEFLDPGFAQQTYLYQQELLGAVKKRPEIKYVIVKRGHRIDVGKGVSADVIAPDRMYGDANNNSIVIKLTYGKVSFLLTGDAEFESEKDMVKNYGDGLKSTVLKVGHHGSAGASGAEFLGKVKPEVVIISVGEKNRFRLPFKEAIDRLEAFMAKIYRTDYQGTITVSTNGETYDVKAEREAPPPEKRWDTVKVLKEEEKINVNTASLQELISLPLIGKVKASRIIERRPYKSVDELDRVPGIGPKTLEHIRPLVTVGKPATAGGPAMTGGGN